MDFMQSEITYLNEIRIVTSDIYHCLCFEQEFEKLEPHNLNLTTLD